MHGDRDRVLCHLRERGISLKREMRKESRRVETRGAQEKKAEATDASVDTRGDFDNSTKGEEAERRLEQ